MKFDYSDFGEADMNARAIIGIKNKDGSIKAGWQWYDGKGLKPLLKRQFNTVEKIEELISNGVWNIIIAPKAEEDMGLFEEWAKWKEFQYYLVPVGKCHLLKERPNDNAQFAFSENKDITVNEDGSVTFKDFETAIGQDIGYLYLFDPETNEWHYCKRKWHTDIKWLCNHEI
jgi:hypothetical protein